MSSRVDNVAAAWLAAAAIALLWFVLGAAETVSAAPVTHPSFDTRPWAAPLAHRPLAAQLIHANDSKLHTGGAPDARPRFAEFEPASRTFCEIAFPHSVVAVARPRPTPNAQPRAPPLPIARAR